VCRADILQAPSPGARRPAHRGLRPAAIVVGVAGARLVIVVFQRPETRVVSIESSTRFVDGHARLFASSGHRLPSFSASRTKPIRKRRTIDVEGVATIVKGV